MKTKIMVSKGKRPVRSKILINARILDQVSYCTYPRCDVSFKFGKDKEKKVNRFQSICGTTGRKTIKKHK